MHMIKTDIYEARLRLILTEAEEAALSGSQGLAADKTCLPIQHSGAVMKVSRETHQAWCLAFLRSLAHQ